MCLATEASSSERRWERTDEDRSPYAVVAAASAAGSCCHPSLRVDDAAVARHSLDVRTVGGRAAVVVPYSHHIAHDDVGVPSLALVRSTPSQDRQGSAGARTAAAGTQVRHMARARVAARVRMQARALGPQRRREQLLDWSDGMRESGSAVVVVAVPPSPSQLWGWNAAAGTAAPWASGVA